MYIKKKNTKKKNYIMDKIRYNECRGFSYFKKKCLCAVLF